MFDWFQSGGSQSSSSPQSPGPNDGLQSAEAVYANLRSLVGELLAVPNFFPHAVEVKEVMAVLERCLSLPQLAVLVRRVWFDLLDLGDTWDVMQQQDWVYREKPAMVSEVATGRHRHNHKQVSSFRKMTSLNSSCSRQWQWVGVGPII